MYFCVYIHTIIIKVKESINLKGITKDVERVK